MIPRYRICAVSRADEIGEDDENILFSQGFKVHVYQIESDPESDTATPQKRALFHHEKVLCAQILGAEMPVSYSDSLRKDEIAAWLEEKGSDISNTCAALFDTREWILGLHEDEKSNDAPELSKGRSYLSQRAKENRLSVETKVMLERLVAKIKTAKFTSLRDVTLVESVQENHRSTISLLQEKGAGPSILKEISPLIPDHKLMLQGPLPPYSFAIPVTAQGMPQTAGGEAA